MEGYNNPVVPKETGGLMFQEWWDVVRWSGPATVVKTNGWGGGSISKATRGFQNLSSHFLSLGATVTQTKWETYGIATGG